MSWLTPMHPAGQHQDIEALLRAGINVISTLNIQHLESLYDLVERATGVKVKERVPDYVLGMADQIINVDLSAEDLRERLQRGKIYPQERIERALDSFFTPENLTRLRELTLGEIAHRLDRRRQAGAGHESGRGGERVMVGLGRAPTRTPCCAGARLADRLSAWYVVYIRRRGSPCRWRPRHSGRLPTPLIWHASWTACPHDLQGRPTSPAPSRPLCVASRTWSSAARGAPGIDSGSACPSSTASSRRFPPSMSSSWANRDTEP